MKRKFWIVLFILLFTITGCSNNKDISEGGKIEKAVYLINGKSVKKVDDNEKNFAIEKANTVYRENDENFNKNAYMENTEINEKEEIYLKDIEDLEVYKVDNDEYIINNDYMILNKDGELIYYNSKDSVRKSEFKNSKKISKENIIKELRESELISKDYYIDSDKEIYKDTTKLIIYPKLNNDIKNIYNSIELWLDSNSNEIIFFMRKDDKVIEENELKPEISIKEAREIAREFIDKDIDIKGDIDKENLLLTNFATIDNNSKEDVYIVEDGSQIFNDKKFKFLYEFKFKDKNSDGGSIYIDAISGKVIYYIERNYDDII